MGWLWQRRVLRVLLIAAPGITAAVGMLTAQQSTLAVSVALNLAVGIMFSSALFIAVSVFARRMADERAGLVRATEQQRNHNGNQRLSIYDENGLFTDWYFRLRVQEEIERSQRYDLEFSILVVKPAAVDGAAADSLSASAGYNELIRQSLRKSDLLALLRDGSVGILLPIKGRRAAVTVKRQLGKQLDMVKAYVGIANYPEDGQTSATLLAVATHAVLSQQDDHEAEAAA
jgi:hypothetical protein